MTAKRMQNTHEKAKLERVKNSKLFHKRDASISQHANLIKQKKYKKVTKTKTKKIHSKKLQISTRVALKKINIKTLNLRTKGKE